MDSGRSTRALPRVGFPIRKSSDQRMVSSFPRLIAAAHVLHRLLAPRHPPCALVLLIRKNTFYCRYGVFKVRVSTTPTRVDRIHRFQETSRAGLSKLNSVSRLHRRLNEGGQSTEPASRSTLFQASRLVWTARRPSTVARHKPSDHSTEPTPTGVRAPVFPRKEVIQPQLPLRLPCYDFTPIINPTFDGCLLAVSSPASGIADFRGVTGGVYKPRVRIHRGVADPRLLATPPS